MNTVHKMIAPHLSVALLFLSLLGVTALGVGMLGLTGCGGGGGKDKDEDETPDPPAVFTLSGKVLAEDGSAIADASVTARMGDGSNAVITTTISAADGAYAVGVPAATSFYVHVAKPAYANTNSHIRVLTATRIGADLVLLLQTQADTLLGILGGPASLSSANFLYLIRGLDSSGAELAGVSVTISPIGLQVFYRQADDTGYTTTGPTVACTAGGGCAKPQMAGYSATVNQGVSTFQLSQAGMVQLALVSAPLAAGEVTFIVND